MSSSSNSGDGRLHELVSFYVLGALDAADRAAFERHLESGCGRCEAELRIFREVAAHIGAGASTKPPESLRQQVLDKVQTSPRTPGVVLSQPGLLIRCSAEMPWEVLAPGVVFKPLFADQTRSYLTALVRMDPGASYPSHRHSDVEELFILSGDLLVEGETMRAGDYCRAETGTVHGTTSTQAGCLFLLGASQLNEVIS
jgi:anti-sigma factor ChrR (cupin superfamily)